jgi:heme-degrading monooxygenase HmoA
MIARLWSARATPLQVRAYLHHFSTQVVPILRKYAGYVGYTLLTRDSAASIEILVTTYWQSLEAIDAFAGPDRDAAVVAPAAAAFLLDYDRRARHYEVAQFNFPASS